MGRGVRRLSGKEAGDTAGNSMAGKSARVTSSQRVASVAQQQLVLGNSPSLQKRCMGTQLEVFTPGVNKGVNARPSVTSRKAHTPTILSYVNKRPRGRLSVVDLTPSPKANTPASKRLILEQFFSKKAKGEFHGLSRNLFPSS